MKFFNLLSKKWFRTLVSLSIIILSYICVVNLLNVFYFKSAADPLQVNIIVVSSIILIPCLIGSAVFLYKTRFLNKEE